MSGKRRRTAVTAALVGLVVLATACPPPGGFPVEQAVPPGGRIVVQGLPNANMAIESINGDLSAVVYLQDYYTFPDQWSTGGRFWLYDDRTGASTLLPVRYERSEGPSGVSVSPDGRWVVFASPDPALQVGPTAMNCRRYDGFFQPMPPIYCAELYRYDLVTEELEQLTGLGGSSPYHHLSPTVLADGRTVEFEYGPGVPESGSWTKRLDLETGVIVDVPDEPCCTWVRDTYDVVWVEWTSTIRKVDRATGEVTTLFTDDERYWARMWSSDDGRYHVFSAGSPETPTVYRLIDAEEETVREVLSEWFSQDGSTFAVVQRNVAPTGDDRLVIAPTAT